MDTFLNVRTLEFVSLRLPWFAAWEGRQCCGARVRNGAGNGDPRLGSLFLAKPPERNRIRVSSARTQLTRSPEVRADLGCLGSSASHLCSVEKTSPDPAKSAQAHRLPARPAVSGG